MDCPFSRDRLHELLYAERWRPDQVALLAQAGTGETVTVTDVEGWCRAYGFSPPPAEPAPTLPGLNRKRPPKPARPAKPRAAKAPCPAERTAPRPRRCRHCNGPVPPTKSHKPRIYCSADCHRAADREAAEKRRVERAALAEQVKQGIVAEEAPALMRCYSCKHHRPFTADYFVVDSKRQWGLKLLCRDCNKKKNDRYYAANAERLRERKRAKREGRSPRAE